MKATLLLSIMSLAAVPAFAVEIVSAKLDASQENLIVNVRHGGGCGKHEYSMKLKGCFESMPVQCQATIEDKTDDFCEAYIPGKAVINLAQAGIVGDYFANGSLTLLGDKIDGVQSSATVQLPAVLPPAPVTKGKPSPKGKPQTPPSSASAENGSRIRCTTHTGSDLVIIPAEKRVRLITKDGEPSDYSIVKSESMSIETFPPIDQTTFNLNDGRSIQTEFISGQLIGKGIFIRLDGSVSPEFKCVLSE